jgi:C-terminal processing protease CtpA/Prc
LLSNSTCTATAREYGVKVGDVITAVNGEVLLASGQSVNAVVGGAVQLLDSVS